MVNMVFLIGIHWIVILFGEFHGVLCGYHENALLKYLFVDSNHNVLERPSENDKHTLGVQLRISLAQLIDMDERNQIMQTSLWLNLQWTDYMMKWDPQKFGNITKISINHQKLWKPDIIMYNSADEKFDGTFPTNVVISYNGFITYIPPGMFKSTCELSMKYYPFDRQTCGIKFGSWSYDGGYINLALQCDDPPAINCSTIGEADLTTFQKNGEWDIIAAKAIRNVKKYGDYDTEYHDIRLEVVIQRRALYYMFNLIIPCILISIISLLVFTLPPDAGEKITLGITSLLALTTFLLMVAQNMPKTSKDIPLMGIYFSCIMFMSSVSVIFTVLVLNYHHRSGDDEVPKFIRVYINGYFARFLMMNSLIDEPASEDPPPAPSNQRYTRSDEHDQGVTSRFLPVSETGLTTIDMDLSYGGAPYYSSPPAPSRGHRTNGPTSRESSFRSAFVPPAQPAYLAPGKTLFDVGIKEKSNRSLLVGHEMHLEDDFRVKSIAWSGGGVSALPSRRLDGGAGGHEMSVGVSANCLNTCSFDLDSDEDDNAKDTGRDSPASTGHPGPTCTTRSELLAILAELKVITDKIEDDEKSDAVTKQWKFAARVIDRACLYSFSVFTLTCTVGILLSAETLWDGVKKIQL